MCTFSLTASLKKATHCLCSAYNAGILLTYTHTAAKFGCQFTFSCLVLFCAHSSFMGMKTAFYNQTEFRKMQCAGLSRKENTTKTKPTKRGYFSTILNPTPDLTHFQSLATAIVLTTVREYDYRPILIWGWSIVASLQMRYLGNKLNTKILRPSYTP